MPSNTDVCSITRIPTSGRRFDVFVLSQSLWLRSEEQCNVAFFLRKSAYLTDVVIVQKHLCFMLQSGLIYKVCTAIPLTIFFYHI